MDTNKKARLRGHFYLAEWTGLEPATPGVTGRYSNQLNYHSSLPIMTCERWFFLCKLRCFTTTKRR